jgi:hypothetical protein
MDTRRDGPRSQSEVCGEQKSRCPDLPGIKFLFRVLSRPTLILVTIQAEPTDGKSLRIYIFNCQWLVLVVMIFLYPNPTYDVVRLLNYAPRHEDV